MIFKDRKIPKHLIIREEYELRNKPRSGILKFIVLFALVASATYAMSAGMIHL